MKTNWILCPICGSKTRNRIREDTVLVNDPLYCPKCKQVVNGKTVYPIDIYYNGEGCFYVNL